MQNEIKNIKRANSIAKFFITSYILFNLVSCRKDYTCSCSSTIGVDTATGNAIIHDTKRKAKQACENGNYTISNGPNTSVTTCTFS